MSANERSGTTTLLKLAGAAAVIGASKVLFRKPPAGSGIAPAGARPTDDGAQSRRSDLITYGIGYGLALLMTGVAFAVVHWRWASGTTALGMVFGLAFAQAVVHVRYFLHVDLRRSARDDLQLILFSTLIIALMVGGTLVVLFNLRMRMM